MNPKDIAGQLKPMLHLVPPTAIIEEAKAMRDGAEKYGPYNWRTQPIQATTYVSAAMRHLAQFLDGEDVDPKSKSLHLGHARAGIGILIDAIACGTVIDDRPPKGAASRLIEEATRLRAADAEPETTLPPMSVSDEPPWARA